MNVQQNGIKKEGMLELLKSIRENPNAEELCLNDNWVKGADAIALLEDITSCCHKLRVLNLSDNNIGDADSEKIFEMAAKNCVELQCLHYNYNELATEGTIRQCLELALTRMPKLKVLEMEGNSINGKMVDRYLPDFKKKGVDCKLRGEDEEEEEKDADEDKE